MVITKNQFRYAQRGVEWWCLKRKHICSTDADGISCLRVYSMLKRWILGRLECVDGIKIMSLSPLHWTLLVLPMFLSLQ
jgi:hypothetical protein